MKKTVAVLGAGIGGKLIAVGVKRKYPDCHVVLVGPESQEPDGLFYLNKDLEGISTFPIYVNYELKESNCTNVFETYQLKSRGEYSPDVKVSSLSKIGCKEIGYMFNIPITCQLQNSGVVWLKDTVTSIDFNKKWITTLHDEGSYDILISTIPFHVLVKLIYHWDVTPQLRYRPIYIETDYYESYLNVDYIKVQYDVTESPYYRISTYYGCVDPYVIEEDEDNLNYDKELGRYKIKVVKESINPGEGRTPVYPGKIIPSDVTVPTFKRYSRKVSAEIIEKEYDLKIVGRYARWDYHYTVDKSYEDALAYVEKKLTQVSEVNE